MGVEQQCLLLARMCGGIKHAAGVGLFHDAGHLPGLKEFLDQAHGAIDRIDVAADRTAAD